MTATATAAALPAMSRAAGWHATGESGVVRVALIAVALAFLALFLFMPLAFVFAQALKKGLQVYVAAILDEDALSAIRLTLLSAAIAVPLNLVFGVAAAWAIAKFSFPRQERPDDAHRPAVLRFPGDRRTDLRAHLRPARLARPVASRP